MIVRFQFQGRGTAGQTQVQDGGWDELRSGGRRSRPGECRVPRRRLRHSQIHSEKENRATRKQKRGKIDHTRMYVPYVVRSTSTYPRMGGQSLKLVVCPGRTKPNNEKGVFCLIMPS